ncbi:fas-associated death domain protein-like [Aphomia sociella]
MISTPYLDLKQKIVYNVAILTNNIRDEPLSSLKLFYKEKINSPRRFDQIDTLWKLLSILEIRDVLSKHDVEPLKEIARRTNNSHDLLKMIADYESRNVQYECQNNYYYGTDYEPKHMVTYRNEHPGHNITSYNTSGGMSPKEQRIYETVKEQIGSYWCVLARKLKIRECHIDEINRTNDDLYVKASKVMELYKRKADPQNWFIILCHALDKAQREDLTETIQDIMMMNI